MCMDKLSALLVTLILYGTVYDRVEFSDGTVRSAPSIMNGTGGL
jgi:hypothetical protein